MIIITKCFSRSWVLKGLTKVNTRKVDGMQNPRPYILGDPMVKNLLPMQETYV